MQIDDPYKTPDSALEPGTSGDPLTRMEEGMVDFMAASRVRTIVFVVLALIGCAVSLGGIVEAFATGAFSGEFHRVDPAARAIVWSIVLAHCALAAFSMLRYLGPVNRVARTYDRQDLEVAIRRRRFARVGWFVMIALMIISLMLPVLYFD
jgi:hypothetical protein